MIAPTVFEHVKHERSLLAHKVRIGYAHLILWIFSWLASAPQNCIQLLISTLPIFIEGALGIHICVSVRETGHAGPGICSGEGGRVCFEVFLGPRNGVRNVYGRDGAATEGRRWQSLWKAAWKAGSTMGARCVCHAFSKETSLGLSNRPNC